jgi:hypothetical protein
MNATKESLLVDVLLLVYVFVSGAVVWIMPLLLSSFYAANNFTFDISLCASLLSLYTYALLSIPLIVGIDAGLIIAKICGDRMGYTS